MDDQIQALKNQIVSEQQKHAKTIQNLKRRLEMLQNSEREKRERNKRSRDIQANSAMQKQASQVNTYTNRSKWENSGCENCINKQLIDSLREIAEKFIDVEF